jgi:hypothetical protein
VGTRPALIFVVTQCLEQAQVPVGEELRSQGLRNRGVSIWQLETRTCLM